MAPSTLLSLTVFFVCFAICWGSGAWLAHVLVPGPRNLRWWSFAAVLGLGTAILTVANLNYLGLPVRMGAPVAVLTHFALSAYCLSKSKQPVIDIDERDKHTLAICLLGLVLFSAPYWITGAYPFFGDSYSNCSVADFVRDNGYHASPEPIHEQGWKTQMWSFANGHYRMGVPYLLATTSAFLGLKAYWSYIGVCFFLLFITTLTFGVLAHSLLPGTRSPLLAIGAYSCNLMMVHWSLASGFLPQTIGLGIAFLLITTGLDLGTGNRRIPLTFGFLLAMQIAFYPEILPFIVAPLMAAVCVERLAGGAASLAATGTQLLQAVGATLLVNGYNVYYAALGYLAVFIGRPMNKIGIKLDQYFTMSFGLSSLTSLPITIGIAAIGLSIILGVVCLFGWATLRGRAGKLVWASIAICAPVGAWMAFSGSEYSLFKVVLYLFYLVPLGTAAGFAVLWKRGQTLRLAALFLIAVWCLTSTYVYGAYMQTAYNVLVDPSYRTGKSNPATYMQDFTSLDGLERITAPRGKTLLLLNDTLPATWVSYFFRAPAHQHFLGVYSQMLIDRPAPPPESFAFILTEKARSSWHKDNHPLFENNRYSLITAQPLVNVTGEGWYQTEYLNDEPVHWMKDSAELLTFSGTPTSIVLEANSMLGPHGMPRQVTIFVEGKPSGSFTVPKDRGRVRTPAIDIPAGFSKIELRSDGKTVPIGADTRTLNILFGRWNLESSGVDAATQPAATPRPAPLSLSLRGATEDFWLTDTGAIIVPSTPTPYQRLRLQIEAANVPKLLPLGVKTTSTDGMSHTWTISKAGRYDVVVALPRPVKGELQLMPDKHFVPRDVGANTDTRRLSFRILSITPLP